MGRKMTREEFEARAMHTLESSYTVYPTPRDTPPPDETAADETPPASAE